MVFQLTWKRQMSPAGLWQQWWQQQWWQQQWHHDSDKPLSLAARFVRLKNERRPSVMCCSSAILSMWKIISNPINMRQRKTKFLKTQFYLHTHKTHSLNEQCAFCLCLSNAENPSPTAKDQFSKAVESLRIPHKSVHTTSQPDCLQPESLHNWKTHCLGCSSWKDTRDFFFKAMTDNWRLFWPLSGKMGTSWRTQKQPAGIKISWIDFP